VPGIMSFVAPAHRLGQHENFERFERAVGLRHRSCSDKNARLDRARVDLHDGGHRVILGQPDSERLAFARPHLKVESVDREHVTPDALRRRGRLSCRRANAEKQAQDYGSGVFHRFSLTWLQSSATAASSRVYRSRLDACESCYMIDLYTFETSNGQRAAIILEECGLPYRVHRVDLTKGEQKSPDFLNINPTGAIPAIVDDDGPGGAPFKLSQSGAIVLYAAEKAGKFVPADPVRRALAMQWLMLAVTDAARASTSIFLCSTVVPDKSPANVAFFEEQTLRYLRVADARLTGREFLADELSIADF